VKIIKIVATRCQILRIKCTKSFVGWGSLGMSVCMSVRPSVKRVYCDKTEEISVQIFTPYERPFSLVFREEEWLVGATPST